MTQKVYLNVYFRNYCLTMRYLLPMAVGDQKIGGLQCTLQFMTQYALNKIIHMKKILFKKKLYIKYSASLVNP